MVTDIDAAILFFFFNTRQAAAYLGISESWLRQRRMTGTLGCQRPAPPFVRLGRSIRYNKSDLDRWLAQQSVHDLDSEFHE
jgi:predicted DNA-binding transcriptional regulator AlpA